ncbi:folate family ECF transporter S component [Tuanshanicoccus lijuaniae]|uniref:folate family ECF transporter S component n=1 Tax=Aerococcaceae bacterium zg-1292 TaxID=2774330 RepID=UPI001BD8FA47|nr:folate family ECF transporter S component [Aerococcaceae bacterium zg-A91]MBS4457416.1 folate family ECF transporter S component [Aerococcaceae bacterium zg-BR33]
MKKKLTTIQLSLLGIILGIRIAISFIPSFKVGQFVELGVGFIGAALSGALFGPFYALIIGVINDIITALIHGKAFFFGYTLSAGIAGLVYGFGLWRKPHTLKRIFITVLCITLFVNLGLGSIWIKMITGKAWEVFMGIRIIKNIVSLFLNTFLLYVLFNHPTIKRYINRYNF